MNTQWYLDLTQLESTSVNCTGFNILAECQALHKNGALSLIADISA